MAGVRLYGSADATEIAAPQRRIIKSRIPVVLAALAVAVIVCALNLGWRRNTVSLYLRSPLSSLHGEEMWDAPESRWEERWALDTVPRAIEGRANQESYWDEPWLGEPASNTEPSFNSQMIGLPDDDLSSFYSSRGCISQPFPDLPGGYLCSSPTHGVYLLDPYGNPYERGIQRRLRAVMDQDVKSIDRVVSAAPEVEASRKRSVFKGNWVNPARWLASSLLPNVTVCQENVLKFYEAISSPSNITEAAGLLGKGFVYQGPDATGLLPACIADVGGKGYVAGAEEWVYAFENQSLAFNGSKSELVGNLSCRPVSTSNVLVPEMFCVARQLCTYTLKTVKSTKGGNQALNGEILDQFWFDSKGLIVRYKTEADPTQFRHANTSLVEEAVAETTA